MTNWTQLITENHAWAHANDGFSLVLSDPASQSDIATLEKQLGIKLPAELHDVYMRHNGFGIRSSADPARIYWTLAPVSRVPELTGSARDWFQETHPKEASLFYPVIDWHCGDYTGYLVTSDGNALDGLFTFEHESYEFDSEQSPEDFLIPSHESLSKFLLAR